MAAGDGYRSGGEMTQSPNCRNLLRRSPSSSPNPGYGTSWWICRSLTMGYVRIVNNLNNQQLQYQCNSKDDDFGLRSLPPKREYEWGFRVNFWDITLYLCNFWYLDNHGV
ncbi:unnamed protein product, partial [Prunus brigantina]